MDITNEILSIHEWQASGYVTIADVKPNQTTVTLKPFEQMEFNHVKLFAKDID